MRLSAQRLSLIVALSALAGTAHASAPEIIRAREGVLNLRVGDIDITRRPNALNDDAFDPTARYLVTLDGPIDPQRRAAFNALGITLGPYLPINTFFMTFAHPVAPADVNALGFVTWAGQYEDAWKLDPDIGLHAFQDPQRIALGDQGKLLVVASLFPSEPTQPVLNAINATGADIHEMEFIGDALAVWLKIEPQQLDALAALNGVLFIEEAPEFTLRNSSGRWIVQSNIQDETPLYDQGLTGEDQLVAIIDGRVSITHCSFFDSEPIGPTHRKIEAYNTGPSPVDFHGTHVAGTFVGDAGAFDNRRGIAYDARFVYNYYPTFSETVIYERFNLHAQQGARVHNNSWGNDGTTAYDITTRAADRFCYDNEDSLLLFAVTDGLLLRNPENAKNLLAVTGSGDRPNQDAWCVGGQGPTSDGRRKPEIAAPGCGITSSSGTSCSSAPLSGTSMATPMVSGVGALMRQYFTEGFYPSGIATSADAFTPSGTLLKALLVNSAQDMTGTTGYPSEREGWGRVLGDAGLFFDGDARTLVVHDVLNTSGEAMTTGQQTEYEVEVTGTTEQFRVTMTFCDPAATAGASFAPINDLDLEVESPTGVIYLGNVFASGESTTGGTADAINNLEQVHISSPETGTWTIRVNATAVNEGTQGHALAITGEVAEPSDCPGDWDGSGLLNTADFIAYLNDYNAVLNGGSPTYADPDIADPNGVLNTADLVEFLNRYVLGCD